MKLDEKKLAKLAETCKTILDSADLDTITEKKVRRQAENELDLEDKILDEEPHKSYVKEIVKKVINDLQMKSESSRSPPQAKTDSRISKTTIKPASTNKKLRKTEVKLEESSKAFEDECSVSSSKPLNDKARSKVSKQSSAESSPKTQASKAQNKIPKSSKAASPSLKPTNREEPSEKPEDIVDYKSPSSNSSNSKSAKSNVMSKSSKQIEQVNKFKETEIKKEVSSEEESESAKEKRTTKSDANKEKRKSRSRVKKKINASSDSDDNKKSDLVLALDEDEKCSSKKATEGGQSRKIRAVEDGGSIMTPENELLARKSDIVGSKNPIGLSGDDAESDNTIKGEDEERILERTIESDEDGHVSQNNSESMGKIEQEPNGSKAESTSPKRVIDSVEDSDDLSSLEDDKPRKKKRRTGKASAPVNKKTVNRTVNSKTVNNKNSKTDNKTTVEKNDKRIKNLKSLISQCGVRKNWAKEFADCRTDSSKIGKLKEILIDLGVEGRPTLEKCKKVRKRRELEAELGAMDVDNIISDDVKETRKARASRGIFNTLRHRSSRVIQSSLEYDDASSDSSDSSEDKHSDFE